MTNRYDQRADMIQRRLALRMAARLNDSLDDVPHDIGERLRAARVRAVLSAVTLRSPTHSESNSPWGRRLLQIFPALLRPNWGRIAVAAPICSLLIGLFAIDALQSRWVADELAEIDSAILMDDLPTAAYTDPGFAQFLRIRGEMPK